MPALSFRHKILLLLVSCMCLAQLVTMVATLLTTESTVRDSVNEDLLVAERTFDQLFDQRFLQLSESVEVLVDDFGFRAALASQDTPTIISALENYAERANASLALFLDNDANVSATTLAAGTWSEQDSWNDLRARILEEEVVLAVFALEGSHFQAVVVPVMAPARIGWILMGFTLDDALAAQFRDITGLHISFHDPVLRDEVNLVSTLALEYEQELIEHMRTEVLFAQEGDGAAEVTLNDERFLTRVHLMAGGSTPLFAVLQKSLALEMLPYRKMQRELVMLFVFVLLVAVLAGAAIGGSIVAPVRKLALLAERIGSGNYGVEIRIDSRDEIGQLGSTLNTMQQEIARREYRILHQTQHDDLTGLPNRYLVLDRIENAIARTARTSARFTIVMLDIARFKKINDTLGHHIGDVLLKETATRLVRRQRKSDTVARMGGDDFLLLLENTDLATSIQLVQNEILPLLTSPHHLDSVEINVKFNCGFVEYPQHADNATALLRRCEIALYEAKSSMSGMTTYAEGHDEGHLRELAIVSDFDGALREGQLKLVYQPKLSLSTGAIRHAEALIRWNHPTFGFLPPDEFVAVLEQTGNINKLTEWVVAEAARQCSVWLAKDIDIVISVNLSARDLLEPHLVQQIERALAVYGVDPGHLILEITESAIMQDPQAARNILRRLQFAGFRIAIDDFGTGYSSLAQLKSLPVEELKIDKSFVLNLTPASQDAVIVKSTIELAHSMKLEVVAEGIETEEALDLLRSYGCDIGQGYYISKPVGAAEFEIWYRNNYQRFVLSESALSEKGLSKRDAA